MTGLHCPNCGNLHESTGKFCMFCGEDLSAAILEYKNKRLPVKLNHSGQEDNTEPQETVKKYPTGRPLPKATKAGQDSPIRKDRGFHLAGFIFRWCC